MVPDHPGICLIAQNACGALCGDGHGHVGGAEHQTTLMARWLGARGHPVSLITWDEGYPDGERHDQVTLLTMCREDAGWPGLRFFHPRMTGLFAAMNRANADVYYHNSAEYVTGLAAWWCRWHKRKFIYSVASDAACDPALPTLPGLRVRWLYRLGLRWADRIIVQTRRQSEMLKQGFGLKTQILPMPCAGPPRPETPPPFSRITKRVAWVGRIDRMKRLELMLEVAEQLPNVSFDIVAANRALADRSPHLRDYARDLYQRARSLPHLTWHDNLQRADLASIYRNAFCLCCTSSYEGFPNTFLEAWSYGRPVVTSFDPDGLVERERLGRVATNPSDFVTALAQLSESEDNWRLLSDNCLRFFADHHALEVAMPRFERAFLEVTEAQRTADRRESVWG